MKLLGEFTTSVRRAFDEIDPNWESYEGLVICGTHAPKNVEALISRITEARENKTPFLGICHGHQLYAIEYARNIRGIKDATSEEFGQGTFVVKKRPELKIGLHGGETFWSNYEVVIDIEWPDHFTTTPSHPEYQSSIDRPHPLLVQFLSYAKSKN